MDPELARRTPPTPNNLWFLPIARRKLLLHIVFLALLSLHEYTAYGRTFMLHLTSSLNLPLVLFQGDEVRMAILGTVTENKKSLADVCACPRSTINDWVDLPFYSE